MLQYSSYITAVEQEQSNEIGTLLNVNSSLSASTVPQANEKILNRVILENHLWERSYATTDVTTLNLIAAQCPLSGGFVVYQARGILTAFGEGQNWDDETICSPISAGRGYYRSQNIECSGLSVYPNPAIRASPLAVLPRMR